MPEYRPRCLDAGATASALQAQDQNEVPGVRRLYSSFHQRERMGVSPAGPANAGFLFITQNAPHLDRFERDRLLTVPPIQKNSSLSFPDPFQRRQGSSPVRGPQGRKKQTHREKRAINSLRQRGRDQAEVMPVRFGGEGLLKRTAPPGTPAGSLYDVPWVTQVFRIPSAFCQWDRFGLSVTVFPRSCFTWRGRSLRLLLLS